MSKKGLDGFQDSLTVEAEKQGNTEESDGVDICCLNSYSPCHGKLNMFES